MNIRPATPADLAAILDLERSCSTAAHWAEAEYTRVFDAKATPRILLIAEESIVVGFIVVRTIGPEWELEYVAVASDARNRGIGRQLLSSVLTQAVHRHVQAVVLEVRASNAAARALYRRAGFTEVGQRNGYYSHPVEDAVLYRFAVPRGLSSAP